MKETYLTEDSRGISPHQLADAISAFVDQCPPIQKVLIIPPDYTRCHSFAGIISQHLYHRFTARGILVHLMPALGTHMPMDSKEINQFFGMEIPKESILVHHWQTDTVKLGVVPADEVEKISGGLYREEIEVEINRGLLSGGYDLILSIGQVVPHEIVGMANYSKNLFVGVGGRSMINKSHLLSAICGMEQALGVVDTPARKLYDYAQQHFVDEKLPVVFFQTVTTIEKNGEAVLNGLYIGKSRKPFEFAAALSQKLNIVNLERRAHKVVTYLNPDEFKTTWVGNKGIYRTRMAVADGGEILILAPGVRSFGENKEMDAMTRRYGYKGRNYVLDLLSKHAFDGKTMSAAHLIQGSSDGRFTITYATRPELMSQQEIEGVGYQWIDYEEAIKRYPPKKLQEGWNVTDAGEEFYYVSNPAAGLWKCNARLG